jgi:hypothetical protein
VKSISYGSLTCISPEFAGDVSTCEKGTPLTAFFDKKIVFDVPPAALPLTSILAAALPNGNRDIEILKFSSGSHSPQRLPKELRRNLVSDLFSAPSAPAVSTGASASASVVREKLSE